MAFLFATLTVNLCRPLVVISSGLLQFSNSNFHFKGTNFNIFIFMELHVKN